MRPEWWEQFRTKDDVVEWLKTNKPDSNFTDFVKAEIPLEKEFQNRIMRKLKYWKSEGFIDPKAYIWKNTSGIYAKGGLPDIMMIADHVFFGFEVKRPFVGRTTSLQGRTLDEMADAGANTAVVCYPNDVRVILENSYHNGKPIWKGAPLNAEK